MNKQVDLISTGEAFSIAEDRGWQFGATHQRLTELAREGRLRFWGYKGSSAELRLIDPLVWQDHGLDPLKGELVIPGKIFARDYAEQVWRDVHVDRQEFEAAFQPNPIEIGSDPTSLDPGEREKRCCEWLMGQMWESLERAPMPKRDYETKAKERFKVGSKAFIRAWNLAMQKTEAKWNLPGPRSRPKNS